MAVDVEVAGAPMCLETISCPYCGAESYDPWAEEAGFSAVRCNACALIYVNPRPSLDLIDAAVRSGVHAEVPGQPNVIGRHLPARAAQYRRVFASLFRDVWERTQAVEWLDVGAGYGEIMEAVAALAPPGSRVVGFEPMHAKAAHAKARGLAIHEAYLQRGCESVDVVSAVDVFSHVPHFDRFLADVVSVLKPQGELFLETGNLADLATRKEFPGELGLPDHLVFAGERHVRGYLENAGFEVVRIMRVRVDGAMSSLKNVVKKIIGRPVSLALPYSSHYRQLLVRARLRTNSERS